MSQCINGPLGTLTMEYFTIFTNTYLYLIVEKFLRGRQRLYMNVEAEIGH
jgi:hypothetical protein